MKVSCCQLVGQPTCGVCGCAATSGRQGSQFRADLLQSVDSLSPSHLRTTCLRGTHCPRIGNLHPCQHSHIQHDVQWACLRGTHCPRIGNLHPCEHSHIQHGVQWEHRSCGTAAANHMNRPEPLTTDMSTKMGSKPTNLIRNEISNSLQHPVHVSSQV